MDPSKTSTQLKAGFFLLLGFLCIGSLVVYFGRFGESMKKYYDLTVDYRNASGLLKGADVMLAGAKIGEVADAPKVLPDMKGVSVHLRIDERVGIPEGSIFAIGSSGLLGDRFVTVALGAEVADPKPIAPGSVITNGQSESSIAELQRQIHDEVLPKLTTALDNIDAVSHTLREDVFNAQGVRNLQATLSNFRSASDNLAQVSGQIQGVVGQADAFLKKGNSAMDSVQGAAGDLKGFLANLRQHGILFYKDTATGPGPLKKAP
jgi:phospholipid/cholesterol/gamma-HCH transport system substrate-binding protein